MNEVAEPRNAVCRVALNAATPRRQSRREFAIALRIQGCRENGLAFDEAGTWSSKSSAAAVVRLSVNIQWRQIRRNGCRCMNGRLICWP